MLALWRKEPSKCGVFGPKLEQNEIFATKISSQCNPQITLFRIGSYSQPKKSDHIFYLRHIVKSSMYLQSQILFVLVLLLNNVAKGHIRVYLRGIVHYHKFWNVRHCFVTTRWIKIMIHFGCEYAVFQVVFSYAHSFWPKNYFSPLDFVHNLYDVIWPHFEWKQAVWRLSAVTSTPDLM
jgi:hypothetical protein